MKHSLIIFLICISCSCSDFFESELGWGFIQKTGGISVSSPFKDQHGVWNLPLSYDVTGRTNNGVTPEEVNSMKALGSPSMKLNKSSVYFYFVAVPQDENGSKPTTISNMKLGNINDGTYDLYYKCPGESEVFIQTIQLK